ncbi:MAG: hypothetical protein GY906_11725 [bacterium]|nr:hypothetical protein [bacterium]
MPSGIEKTLAILLKIPLVLYVIGLVVHNIYLSQYSVYDFELLHARYVLAGAVTVLAIAVSLMLLTIRLDLDDYRKNLSYPALASWSCRISMYVLIAHLFLFSGDPLIQGVPADLQILDPLLLDVTVRFAAIAFFSVFMMDTFLADLNDRDRLFSAKFIKVQERLGPLFLVIVVSLAIGNSEIRALATHFFMLAVFLVAGLAGWKDSRDGHHTQPLANGSTEAVSQTWSLAFGPLLVLLGIGPLLVGFSANLYPKIPSSLGGARPIPVEVVLRDGTLNASLISEGPDWITVIDPDSSDIRRIPKSLVSELRIAQSD